jgi:hypothetical protein
MPRLTLLATLAALATLAFVAACGGSSASDGSDPASAVPRDAPLYVEAVLRPEGQLREDALAAAGKLLRTPDPEARIRELVDEAFARSDDPRVDYGKDIEPWLGERVGVWFEPAKGGEFGGAAILATTDEEAAREAIERLNARAGERETDRSHGGVDYKLSGDGDAWAIFDGFVVAGNEPQVKRTIDARDGDGLGESDTYEGALEGLEEDRLGAFYLQPKALFDLAAQDPRTGPQIDQFRRLYDIDRLGPTAGAFTANGDRLALDVVQTTPEEAAGALGPLATGGTTPLLGELPGDAWGALGVPKFGATLKTFYDQAAGALGGAALREQLRSELGLDLERDVFSWIGDVAFFVRGESRETIDGGVVIQVTDEAAATSAFGKLVGLIQSRGGVPAEPVEVDGADAAFAIAAPDAPGAVVLARGNGRVVAAYGREAAAEALEAGEKLSDSPAFSEAQSVLGDDLQPTFLLSMAPIVALADATSGDDPEWAEVKPYLEALSVVAAGGKPDGERARSRLAVGLR